MSFDAERCQCTSASTSHQCRLFPSRDPQKDPRFCYLHQGCATPVAAASRSKIPVSGPGGSLGLVPKRPENPVGRLVRPPSPKFVPRPARDIDTLQLSDDSITEICRKLVERGAYASLANFIRTSRRVYNLCRPVLREAKEAIPVFEVTDDPEEAMEQTHASHPHHNDHAYFIQPDGHYKINDVIFLVVTTGGEDFVWIGQREYNSEDPGDFGYQSKTYPPHAIKRRSEIAELLKLGYYALLVNRGDGSYQYDDFRKYLGQCRHHTGPCLFFYNVVPSSDRP